MIRLVEVPIQALLQVSKIINDRFVNL